MGTKSATSAAPTMGATTPASPAAAPLITSFESLEATMTSVTALGPDGKKYVQTLSELFEKKTGGRIVIDQVPHRFETVAAIDTASKQAVILVFNESYIASQPVTPVSEYMPDIIAAFKNKNPDVNMVQYIVVIPEDYARVEQMSTTIINIFQALNPNVKLTAETFNQMRLAPCTDLKQVMQFIDKYSPHAVPDRADWGVLINRLVNNERLAGFQNFKEPEAHGIIAVTGYTKFIRTNVANTIKYLPVCVITNVVSTIPSVDILPLALPIVAGCIVAQRVWERPYMKFSKNTPNLGRLVTVQNDKGGCDLGWFSSPDQMHSEMAKFMVETPLLAMDCAEGRARIPGLQNYILQDANFIMQQITEFFGPQAAAAFTQLNQAPIITTFFNYEGNYKNGGKLVDTRNGDYINMVTETQNYQRCQRALAQATTPNQHLQDIVDIYGEDVVSPLYRVYTIVFNGALVNTLASMISSIVRYTNDACVNQNVDMGALLAQYGTAIGGSNAIYGGYCNYVAPGSVYR